MISKKQNYCKKLSIPPISAPSRLALIGLHTLPIWHTPESSETSWRRLDPLPPSARCPSGCSGSQRSRCGWSTGWGSRCSAGRRRIPNPAASLRDSYLRLKIRRRNFFTILVQLLWTSFVTVFNIRNGIQWQFYNFGSDPPSGSNSLHFHAVFGKIWQHIRLATPFLSDIPFWEIPDPLLYRPIFRIESHMIGVDEKHSGGSKGGARDKHPLGVQIISISCSF